MERFSTDDTGRAKKQKRRRDHEKNIEHGPGVHK